MHSFLGPFCTSIFGNRYHTTDTTSVVWGESVVEDAGDAHERTKDYVVLPAAAPAEKSDPVLIEPTDTDKRVDEDEFFDTMQHRYNLRSRSRLPPPINDDDSVMLTALQNHSLTKGVRSHLKNKVC